MGTHYGPLAVLRRLSLLVVVVSSLAVGSATARAQSDEVAGDARGGYAWGSGGGSAAPAGEDPLRIQAFAGFGAGVRPLRNLDQPFQQQFATPLYIDVGGAVFLPGGDLRHGAGLTVSTNVSDDPSSSDPMDAVSTRALTQWSLTPSYHLLLPLWRWLPDMEHDILQIQGRLGVPLVVGSSLSGDGSVDFALGVEVGAAINWKLLAGLGVYAEIQATIYGGQSDTLHPVISMDIGLLFDYEVLP